MGSGRIRAGTHVGMLVDMVECVSSLSLSLSRSRSLSLCRCSSFLSVCVSLCHSFLLAFSLSLAPSLFALSLSVPSLPCFKILLALSGEHRDSLFGLTLFRSFCSYSLQAFAALLRRWQVYRHRLQRRNQRGMNLSVIRARFLLHFSFSRLSFYLFQSPSLFSLSCSFLNVFLCRMQCTLPSPCLSRATALVLRVNACPALWMWDAPWWPRNARKCTSLFLNSFRFAYLCYSYPDDFIVSFFTCGYFLWQVFGSASA